MKGAAMKVGQVASFIDTGAFQPEFQERVRRSSPSCATRRHACRSTRCASSSRTTSVISWATSRRVRGAPWRPHRSARSNARACTTGARWREGEYGCRQAVRADLQNWADHARGEADRAGHGREAMTAEIARAAHDESTTSTRRSSTARSAYLARAPFIYVPASSRSSPPSTFVSEWVDGMGFER